MTVPGDFWWPPMGTFSWSPSSCVTKLNTRSRQFKAFDPARERRLFVMGVELLVSCDRPVRRIDETLFITGVLI